MARTIQDTSKICRFCLCETCDLLQPLSNILDDVLTFDSIERITSIQISSDSIASCAICVTCKETLSNYAEFRRFCWRNDIIFKRMFSAHLLYLDNGSPSPDDTHVISKSTCYNVEFLEDDETTEQDQLEANHLEQSHLDISLNLSQNSEIYQVEIDETSSNSNEESHEKDSLCSKLYMQNESTTSGDATHNEPFGRRIQSTVELQKQTVMKRKKQLCVICGKLISNLSHHKMIHAKDNVHQCPHCPTTMTNSSNLIRHIQAVHLKKIVKSCVPCGRGFTHVNSYNSHMRARHGAGEPFQCQICSKTFKQPSSYKKHLAQSHSDERKFACSKCNKHFKDKQTLKLHESVHSTDRPYACSKCSKRFKSSSARKTHELTHSGIVFECKSCDKIYRYKSVLKMHVAKFHTNV